MVASMLSCGEQPYIFFFKVEKASPKHLKILRTSLLPLERSLYGLFGSTTHKDHGRFGLNWRFLSRCCRRGQRERKEGIEPSEL